jgi:hypothetical protein
MVKRQSMSLCMAGPLTAAAAAAAAVMMRVMVMRGVRARGLKVRVSWACPQINLKQQQRQQQQRQQQQESSQA